MNAKKCYRQTKKQYRDYFPIPENEGYTVIGSGACYRLRSYRIEVPEGVTDEQLLKEAESALHSHKPGRRGSGVLWATLGAMGTGLVWLLTALF